jgi:hypothetical protein
MVSLLQVLFAAGLLGGVVLMANSTPEPAALQVVQQPWLVWQVCLARTQRC